MRVELIASLLVLLVLASSTQAQDRRSGHEKSEGLLNQDYLTSTGATVPHPGQSQGAPTDPLDRRTGREDNRIDDSICSNCK